MTITPKTTVHTLLKEYPFLLEYLAAYHPEFGKLTNPVLRRTMGRMATLDKAAQLANVPLNQLMNDVAGEIQAKTGARPDIADTPGVDTVDPARLDELAAIVGELHAGKTPDEVKPRFEELIADVEATISVASTSAMSSSKRGLTSSGVLPACSSPTMAASSSRRAGSTVSTPGVSAMSGRAPVFAWISPATSFMSWLRGTLASCAALSRVAMRPMVRRSTGLVSLPNSGW